MDQTAPFTNRPDAPQTRARAGGVILSGLMVLGLLTASVALVLMWTFLTDPVEVARTVRHGNTGEVARLVAAAFYDLVVRLVAWL